MHEERTTKAFGALCVWFVVAQLTSCCGFEWAFVLEPEDVVAVNRSSIVLNCAINSTNGSSVEISWRRNGEALVPDGRQYILSPNGSLLIPSFSQQQPNDKEMYECIAMSGSSAVVSRQAWLQVAVLGNFSGHPQSLDVQEGENARFECTVSGVPKPTVVWMKNGQPLPQSERFKELGLPANVLQIVNVSTSDAGNYICQASNDFGQESTSSSAHLAVHLDNRMETIRLLAGPKDLEVEFGDTATFECFPSHGHASIVWKRKDGSPLPSDRSRISNFGNLEILDVETLDADKYTCEVDGSSELFGEATLSVIEPPTLVACEQTGSQIRAQTVEMTCEFFGVPNPAVTWLKNAQPFRGSGRIKFQGNNMLKIGGMTDSDSGLYQCWAENRHGRAGGAVFPLTIKGSGDEPDPPINVRAHVIDSKTIDITWQRPPRRDPLHPLVAYSVNHWPTLGGDETQNVHEDNKTRMVKVTPLQPNTNYTFYVVAFNQRGASVHSAYVVQATKEDVPSTAPELKVSPLSATSLELTWKELNSSQARGVIMYYKIFYKKHEEHVQDITVQDITVPSDILRYELTDLETDETYSVCVLAATKAGLSKGPCPWVMQVVSDTVPSTAPELKVSPLSATSLELTWKELTLSQARGVITYYKIFYKKHEEHVQDITVQDITVPSDILRYELTDLETGETYSVCVLAATKAGLPKLNNWPWVSQVVGFRVPLSNVKIYPLDATRVHMTWDNSSEFSKAGFVGFKVHYSLPGEEERMITLTEEPTEFTLEGLEPDSVYEISIRAFTEVGDGEVYHKTVRTPPAGNSSPGPPSSPLVISEVKPVNETAIRLSWLTPPYKVTSYSISCVSATADTDDRPQEKFFNCTSTHLVISGLRPFMEYRFTVQSHTPAGPGPRSSEVTCRTEASRPPGLLKLSWFLQEATVVQLNWKMPPHANEIVSHYVVSYCEDKFAADHPWHTHIENGTLCYTVLRDLKSRTTYQVRMHAVNKKGAGPASSIRVLTGITSEPEPGGSSSDRLMGIVIGIGISGGCIIICVIIILLRNRCLPPFRGPPVVMQHANGFTTPLHSNGFVTGPMDDKHGTNFHEPDGTTPMLNQPQESDNIEHITEMPSSKSKQLHMWRSVDGSRKAGSTDKSTTIV